MHHPKAGPLFFAKCLSDAEHPGLFPPVLTLVSFIWDSLSGRRNIPSMSNQEGIENADSNYTLQIFLRKKIALLEKENCFPAIKTSPVSLVRDAFKRLMREIVYEHDDNKKRIQRSALLALQKITESFICFFLFSMHYLFALSLNYILISLDFYLLIIHAHRVIIQNKNIQLMKNLMKNLSLLYVSKCSHKNLLSNILINICYQTPYSFRTHFVKMRCDNHNCKSPQHKLIDYVLRVSLYFNASGNVARRCAQIT